MAQDTLTAADRFRHRHQAWSLAQAEYDKALKRVEHFATTARPWDAASKRFVITQKETDASCQLHDMRLARTAARNAMLDAAHAWAIESLGSPPRASRAEVAGRNLARTTRRLAAQESSCDWPEDCGCFRDLKDELTTALKTYRRKAK